MAYEQVQNDPGYFGGQAPAVNARIGQMLDPTYQNVSLQDQDIAPLAQSINAQSQRGARRARASAAESAAADGTLNSGGFGAIQRQIEEQARQGAGDQLAGLLWNKSQMRNQNMMDAMGMGGQLVDGQQNRNLQRESTYIDRDLRNRGMDIQNNLGQGDLNVRNRSIDEQGRQFNDRLGFDRSAFEANMNDRIIQNLLGGYR
jgi:hypothetical protein